MPCYAYAIGCCWEAHSVSSPWTALGGRPSCLGIVCRAKALLWEVTGGAPRSNADRLPRKTWAYAGNSWAFAGGKSIRRVGHRHLL